MNFPLRPNKITSPHFTWRISHILRGSRYAVFLTCPSLYGPLCIPSVPVIQVFRLKLLVLPRLPLHVDAGGLAFKRTQGVFDSACGQEGKEGILPTISCFYAGSNPFWIEGHQNWLVAIECIWFWGQALNRLYMLKEKWKQLNYRQKINLLLIPHSKASEQNEWEPARKTSCTVTLSVQSRSTAGKADCFSVWTFHSSNHLTDVKL